MNPKIIFYPVLAQVLLTFLVGLRVMQTRVGLMKRKRIHPQALADGSRWDELLRDAEAPSVRRLRLGIRSMPRTSSGHSL